MAELRRLLDNLHSEIAPIVEELRKPGTCVVVHCRSGQIRSAALIASILIVAGGLTLDEAEAVLAAHCHHKGGSIPRVRSFDKFDVVEQLQPGSYVAPTEEAGPAEEEEEEDDNLADAADPAAPEDRRVEEDGGEGEEEEEEEEEQPEGEVARPSAASAAAAPADSSWSRVTRLSQELTDAVTAATHEEGPPDMPAFQVDTYVDGRTDAY